MTALRAERRAAPDAAADARLLAWRDAITIAATELLRRYSAAWTDTAADDASRAAAGVGIAAGAGLPGELPVRGPLADLAAVCELDAAREAVLAAAWWSAVDPQVAVLFGCVHDDATRRYVSLGALALLFGPEIPLILAPHDPLVAAGLLEQPADAAGPIRLPAATAELLDGAAPPQAPAPPVPARLALVVERAAALVELGGPVLVRCEVPEDRSTVRAAIAARLGYALAVESRPAPTTRLLHRLGRELAAAVVSSAADIPDGCVLACAGSHSAVPAGWHTLDVAAPAVDAAVRTWQRELQRAGVAADSAEISELAGRLPLGEEGVRAIVSRAARAARAAGTMLTAADVRTVLRAHPRHDLAGLAHRLPACLRLDDLVLGPRTLDGLHTFVAHARQSALAHTRMGFTGARGRAVIGLFHGPSGTGKTAAAEALAAELDRDLWVVDMSRVVSKWLGETQRNLDTVLTEAAAAGAVLLFDEADGLFGRRGEVTDARDRYANLEVDHLLQRIELHVGAVILTSNRPSAIDDAFARRVRIAVRFDLPDHAQRERLWARLIPAELLADGASTEAVAREALSGAAIRAAALGAVVAALEDGGRVETHHLLRSVARELDKAKRPARGGRLGT